VQREAEARVARITEERDAAIAKARTAALKETAEARAERDHSIAAALREREDQLSRIRQEFRERLATAEAERDRAVDRARKLETEAEALWAERGAALEQARDQLKTDLEGVRERSLEKLGAEAARREHELQSQLDEARLALEDAQARLDAAVEERDAVRAEL
jgi:hypothetical protein